MNKKQLSKYYYLSLEIKDIQSKLEEIRTLSVGVAKMTGMPFSTKVGNPTEEQAMLIIKYTQKLEKKQSKALAELLKIEDYISNIEDVETRLIFTKRYIELKKWEKIALEMFMSERTIFRKHKDQLKKGEIQC